MARYKSSGNLKIKKEIRTGRKEKIQDLSKLGIFIRGNNHPSLMDMANKLSISKSSLHHALIKANFTFKKSHGYTGNERKKKEVKSYYRKLSHYFDDKIRLIEMVLLEAKVSIV